MNVQTDKHIHYVYMGLTPIKNFAWEEQRLKECYMKQL